MRLFSPIRRLAAIGAVTAVLSAGAVLMPVQAEAFTTTNGVRLNAFEARITALINQARTSRGIPALTVASGTTDLARRWSMNQATKNTLYHNPNLVYGVTHHGSPAWRAVAENVGRGWGAESLFTAYMNSPGHRANILDRSMRFLGIGWVERPDGSGYNTQVFVDSYTSTYGRTREPALGGLQDVRTPSATTNVGSFEAGWDPRVLLARSGVGLLPSGPQFEAPATGDQSVRFGVRETTLGTGGGVELRIRDALDLRNARAITVRLGANTASGKAITVDITAKRELGSSVTLGRVTIPSGRFVTATFALPATAKNFRNVIGVAIPRTALQSLSTVLSGRSVQVRVQDVTVVV